MQQTDESSQGTMETFSVLYVATIKEIKIIYKNREMWNNWESSTRFQLGAIHSHLTMWFLCSQGSIYSIYLTFQFVDYEHTWWRLLQKLWYVKAVSLFFCVYELFPFKSIRHDVASMETLLHRLTGRRNKRFLPI